MEILCKKYKINEMRMKKKKKKVKNSFERRNRLKKLEQNEIDKVERKNILWSIKKIEKLKKIE